MEKTEQIIKNCRVTVDGITYCIWKIPESEKTEVRNSALADLIRDVNSETLVDVMESARDVIHCDNNFGYPCERNSIQGCDTFSKYSNIAGTQLRIIPRNLHTEF